MKKPLIHQIKSAKLIIEVNAANDGAIKSNGDVNNDTKITNITNQPKVIPNIILM